jgi:5-hydroxyisourate hydrolase
VSVSTHVLDAVNGVPAAGLTVTLQAASPATVTSEVDRGNVLTATLARAVTDDDGRIKDFHLGVLPEGDYRLVFATGPWFSGQGRATFYPEVLVAFSYDGSGHVHVPVLLSAFSYTTYRGS